MTKKALGRGLDALISGGVGRTVVVEPPHVAVPATVVSPILSSVDAAVATGARQVAVEQIDPSRFQPRKEFDAEQLHELSASIKQHGVMQPLLVRPFGAGRFELIAGERRWRAAREAGLAHVPVIVREAGDQEALELALIENLQREDLNAIEEAKGYEQLASQFHLTQEAIAEKVGRSRAAVANALRLLGLPSEVQSWVAHGRLSVGHAKAILGLAIAEEQRLVAERVLKQSLTVRETEQLVEQLKGLAKPTVRALGSAVKDPNILTIEERLRQKLGTGVKLRHGRNGKGRIAIEYYSNDELARVLGLLGVENL